MCSNKSIGSFPKGFSSDEDSSGSVLAMSCNETDKSDEENSNSNDSGAEHDKGIKKKTRKIHPKHDVTESRRAIEKPNSSASSTNKTPKIKKPGKSFKPTKKTKKSATLSRPKQKKQRTQVENEGDTSLVTVKDFAEIQDSSDNHEEEELTFVNSYKVHPKLKQYYEYLGSIISPGNATRLKFKCKLCVNGPPKYAAENNLSNFVRHLKLQHQINVKLTIEKLSREEPSVVDYFKKTVKVEAKSPIQVEVDKALVDLVAVDGLPVRVTEGLAFKNLCSILNPTVQIKTRSTISRYIKKKACELESKKFTSVLKNTVPGSVHLIADIWSSKQNEAVLGVKLQFLDEDFEMKKLTLGFVSFDERHTGINIKMKLEKIIARRGLTAAQIGLILADNASNVKKAFCMGEILEYDPTAEDSGQSGVESGDEDIDDEISQIDSECESPDEADYPCEGLQVVRNENPTWNYQGCLAHLLQLAINNAIKDHSEVTEIIQTVNKIINKFRVSVYWTQQLKTKTGLSLLTMVKTRWNSIVTALERFSSERVFTKLQQVLLEYNSSVTLAKQIKVPAFLTRTHIKELVKILLPFRQATNILQSNEVTSSCIIPSILTLYHHCIKCQSHLFKDFIGSLKLNLRERFSPALSDKKWAIASFLDPRQKVRAFGSTVNEVTKILPKKEEVQKEVEMKLKEFSKDAGPVSSQRVMIDEREEPSSSKKKKDDKLPSIFTILADCEDSAKVPKTEIDKYLDESIEDDQVNPLHYWQGAKKRFPSLAILARVYLSMPATSGDVERLFSVAGVLKRQHRNRLLIKTV